MPHVAVLVKESFTTKQWLNYYKNIWSRNHAARVIDMYTDIRLKAEDPNQMVTSEDGREIMVKERLEHRKILVQDAIDLLKTVDDLLARENIESAWDKEALAVAPDMLPDEPKKETDTKEGAEATQEKTEPTTEAKI